MVIDSHLAITVSNLSGKKVGRLEDEYRIRGAEEIEPLVIEGSLKYRLVEIRMRLKIPNPWIIENILFQTLFRLVQWLKRTNKKTRQTHISLYGVIV